MAFTKDNIAAAFMSSFPELGTVVNVTAIMEDDRFAYRISTQGKDYFTKSIPLGTRNAPEETMRIQGQLHDTGLKVAKPYGVMSIEAYTFIVEEFRPGKHITHPEPRHLIQVASALAAQHLTTELPHGSHAPEFKRFGHFVERLNIIYSDVFRHFEEAGLPRDRWKEELINLFMEKVSGHALTGFVNNSSHFSSRETSPLDSFRATVSRIAEMIMDGNILGYITGFYDDYIQRQLKYAPYLHMSRLHGDPNPDNILYDAKGVLQTIIDYEYTHFNPSYLDLSAAIGSQFRNYEGEKIDWRHAQQMVGAYNQVRPLSTQEVEMIPAAIHSRNVLIATIKLLEISQILSDDPLSYFSNPVKRLTDLTAQQQEFDEVAGSNILYPKDTLQQQILHTFFPYLNTRHFSQGGTSYETPGVSKLLDAVESFLAKENIDIPYDPLLPPREIPPDFSSIVGLTFFRLNKAPMLHNQPPLSQYYTNNMGLQRNIRDLMFDFATYCGQAQFQPPIDFRNDEIGTSPHVCVKSSVTPSGIEEIASDRYPDFKTPVVFELGGLGIQDGGNPALIKNDLGRADILTDHVSNVGRYCVIYPRTPMVLYGAYIREYNLDPQHFYSEYAMQFVQEVLLRAISPSYAPVHPQAHRYRSEAADEPVVIGERYPDIEKLKVSFGNIRFCTHSYGACFVQEVRNALARCMSDLGYNAQEIIETMPAIFSLNTGVLARTDIRKEGDFSQFNIVLETDIVSNNCADHRKHVTAVVKGDIYTMTSQFPNTVNCCNHVMGGELYYSTASTVPDIVQRSAHEWEFYLRDGYDGKGRYHDNSSLPKYVFRKAIEMGAAVAINITALFPEPGRITHTGIEHSSRDQRNAQPVKIAKRQPLTLQMKRVGYRWG